MPEQVLLDNDVVLKVACYAVVTEALTATTSDGTPPGMLGVGRFVIRRRVERATNIADRDRARDSLERMIATVEMFEPTEDELSLAADLEAEASRQGLELDGGESQLLAIVAMRNFHCLLTGDKRAITAMATVAMALAAGRILCFEQLMARIVAAVGADAVRPRVCGEPQVDRALTACFGCARDAVPHADVVDGLDSYVGHLERTAPGVLMRDAGPY
jgi:hypothetical protein